jgi:nickel/cobalt exporter
MDDATARSLMQGAIFFLTSFWLGALHAATPGHGKTIAAAYIVGARGRPVDALVLGIFVTLSHTSGIILVAVAAAFGMVWLAPQRLQAYLSLATGLLVVIIGLWLLFNQSRFVRRAAMSPGSRHGHSHGQERLHAHEHPPAPGQGQGDFHRHGFAATHAHDLPRNPGAHPSLPVLLWLGIAGGLVPDPAALAILLASFSSGMILVGLLTVIAFSLGFASVLVMVAAVAARAGALALRWLDSRWLMRLRLLAAGLILVVGLLLTAFAVPPLLRLA